MRARGRIPWTLALMGGLLAVSACAPLGAMDGVVLGGGGGGARTALVEGEIRSVDARRARLQVRDQWNRSHTVRYDRRTLVVYRQRQYPVTALERGDVVRIRLVRDRGGSLWADRVDVRESVRDRGRVYGRTERVTGTVAGVDRRRGYFTIQPSRYETLVVHVPGRLHRDDARRFDRLRRGDRVRVEVRAVGRGAAELVRFR
jgi:hypothetical protein